MTPPATVPLALDDLVPVVLSGAACALLARYAGDRVPRVRNIGYAGAAAVAIGGLLKVVWKFIVAVDGRDLHWMQASLFGWLAVGFTALAWSLLAAYRGHAVRLWPFAVIDVAALAASLAIGKTGPLLAVTIVGATATGVIAILLARRAGDVPAAIGFGVQVALAYALVPFTVPPQTIAKQWGEQSINTVAQAAFLWAAWRLAAAVVPRPRRDAETSVFNVSTSPEALKSEVSA